MPYWGREDAHPVTGRNSHLISFSNIAPSAAGPDASGTKVALVTRAIERGNAAFTTAKKELTYLLKQTNFGRVDLPCAVIVGAAHIVIRRQEFSEK